MKIAGPQLRAFFLRLARWLFVIGLLGLLTPWPVAGCGWFGIPIVGVWAFGDWCVKDHGLGPWLGGDDWPVRVELVRGCR